MREYELYMILDADAGEEAAQAIVEKVSQLILAGHGGTGGQVVKVNVRGKRRLAFPIKKKLEGHDVILTFHTPPQALAEIERILKLEERVLRYLLTRTDET